MGNHFSLVNSRCLVATVGRHCTSSDAWFGNKMFCYGIRTSKRCDGIGCMWSVAMIYSLAYSAFLPISRLIDIEKQYAHACTCVCCYCSGGN